MPAKAWLIDGINESVHVKLTPMLGYSDGDERVTLSLVLENLNQAMWMQFLRAINRAINFRECRICGTWFEVSLDVARKSRRFCHDKCKMKAYRLRKQQAISMRRQGKSLSAISKTVDSRPANVKAWLAGVPKGNKG